MCMCAAPQADEHNVATSCAPRKHTVCKFIIILRRVWNSKRMRFHTNRMMRCVLAECVFSFLIFVVVDVCINYTKCIQQAAAEKEKKTTNAELDWWIHEFNYTTINTVPKKRENANLIKWVHCAWCSEDQCKKVNIVTSYAFHRTNSNYMLPLHNRYYRF